MGFQSDTCLRADLGRKVTFSRKLEQEESVPWFNPAEPTQTGITSRASLVVLENDLSFHGRPLERGSRTSGEHLKQV